MKERTCYKCGKTANEVKFYARKRNRDGLDNICSECSKARTKKSNRKLRLTVLEHYGNKCACCETDDYEFLCIDHINGGGHQRRKKIGHGATYMRWIVKNNFPEEYRVLCHNCNQALSYYGYCPHGNLPEHRGGK